MSKKILSILLSSLMVITSIACLFTTSASAEDVAIYGDELIYDGGFDDPAAFNTGKDETFSLGQVYSLNGTTFANYSHNKWYRTTGGTAYGTGNSNQVADLGLNPNYVEGGTAPKWVKADFNDLASVKYVLQNVARVTAADNNFVKLHSNFMQSVAVGPNSTYNLKLDVYLLNNTTTNVYFVQPLIGNQTATSYVNYTDLIYKIATVESNGSGYTAAISNGKLVITPTTAAGWTSVDVNITLGGTELTPGAASSGGRYVPETLTPTFRIDPGLSANTAVADVVADGGIDSTAYNPSGAAYANKAMFVDNISLKQIIEPVAAAEFYNENGKLASYNDYFDALLTQNSDGTITATADYDKESGAYHFMGWYKGDELLSTFDSYTFTFDGTPITPRVYTENLLSASGVTSMENLSTSEDLIWLETAAAETISTFEPQYPTGMKFAPLSWRGYVVKLDNGNYTNGTYAGDIVNVAGAVLKDQTYYNVNTEGIKGSKSTFMVSGDYAKYGDNSIKITNVSVAYAMGMEVEPNTKYTISYYVKSDTAADLKFGSSVFSTLNVGLGEKYNDNQAKYCYEDYPRFSDFGGYTYEALSDFHKEYFVMAHQNITTFSNTDWQKITQTFTTGANHEKVYLSIGRNLGSANLYFDNFVLTADNTTTKVTIKNADNEVIENSKEAEGVLVNNYDGTSTASLIGADTYNAYIFDGWYDAEGNLLSAEESFTFATGTYAAKDLTAVVITRNLLTDAGSFEQYEVGQYLSATNENLAANVFEREPNQGEWIYGKNAGGYYGAIKAGTTAYDKSGNAYNYTSGTTASSIETRYSQITDEFAYTGEKSLMLHCYYGFAETPIDVKRNTDYIVSYYAYGVQGTTINKTGIVSSVNVGTGSELTALAHAMPNLTAVQIVNQSSIALNGSWQKITLTFNSGSLDRVWLYLQPTANQVYYIDNLVVAEDFVTYSGTAIRAESEGVPQALRNKFTISKDLIDGVADWTVEEYGSIAMAADYLDTENPEFKIDGTYNGKTPVKGVAFNRTEGKNIVFSQTDTAVTFTAALTGIGKTKGSDVVDYTKWGNTYAVRNYVVITKGDRREVLYSDVVGGSIFVVMQLILENGLESDKAIVNSLLENAEIKAAYDAFVEANS